LKSIKLAAKETMKQLNLLMKHFLELCRNNGMPNIRYGMGNGSFDHVFDK
jgi:hypothetical protein